MPPSYVNVVLCCVLNSISKEVMSKLFFPSGLVERKIVYKKSAFLQMNEHFLATERIFNKLISCFLRPLVFICSPSWQDAHCFTKLKMWTLFRDKRNDIYGLCILVCFHNPGLKMITVYHLRFFICLVRYELFLLAD